MNANSLVRNKRPTISPLRYPGGKASLYSRLRHVIRTNGLAGCTYVEPYAGGAGAALGLLVTGQVDRIVVNDLDPAIHAFWTTLVNEPEYLMRRTSRVALDVKEWRRQRHIYDEGASGDIRKLAFATFYLNRTNRSGVLNGGPIGGQDQTGNYKIDARFNRDDLAERMRIISRYHSRIVTSSLDGRDVIRTYAKKSATFIYADPPYFEKAGSLYLNTFSANDHEALAKTLNGLASRSWLVTYDSVPQVAKLYPDRRRHDFSLRYSARVSRNATETVVLSDALLDVGRGWDISAVADAHR